MVNTVYEDKKKENILESFLRLRGLRLNNNLYSKNFKMMTWEWKYSGEAGLNINGNLKLIKSFQRSCSQNCIFEPCVLISTRTLCML